MPWQAIRVLLLCLAFSSQAAQQHNGEQSNAEQGNTGSVQYELSKAKKKPAKLELGIGVFSLVLPQYLGSDQYDRYVVPLPYIYYLDDDVKIDRNQFTGKLWQTNNIYVDLSVSAGIKVNSEANAARENMADLDWVFELGPSLKYYFSGDPQQSSYFYVEFFTRKATATDFNSFTDVGWRYGPSVTFQKAFTVPAIQQGKGEFEFTSRANINFSDKLYHNYYYGVTPQYQQYSRPAYSSAGGYAGSDISIGLTYKIKQWWLGGFARYYSLSGAEFDVSPLVKQQNNFSLGFGLTWLFYQN